MSDSTDQSIGLLNHIFDFSGVISALSGGGKVQTDTIMSMFQIFNSFAMGATGLVILYMWSVAIMQTAHEGEPLGKRYSTLWTPIRTVAAMVFVSPFPGLGGFSVLQALILMLVSLSISGANMLYSHELTWFGDHGGSLLPVAQSAKPDTSTARMMLQSETCARYMTDNWGPVAYRATQHVDQRTGTLSWTGSKGGVFGIGATNKSCGTIKVDCSATTPGTGSAALCWARFAALNAMATKLNPIADTIYRGKQPKKGAMQQAMDAYTKTWNTDAGKAKGVKKQGDVYIAQLDPKRQKAVKQIVKDGKHDGWLSAGQWYWTTMALSVQQADQAKPRVAVTGYSRDSIPNYRESFAPHLALLSNDLSASQVSLGDSGSGSAGEGNVSLGGNGGTPTDSHTSEVGGDIGKMWGSAVGSGLHTWTSVLTNGEYGSDVLRNLAGYGQWMIGAGWGLIGTATAAKAVAHGAKHSWFGEAADLLTGGASAVTTVVDEAASMMVIAAAWLIGIGGVLAYYIPAVPFIFWSLAVLGWLIMVVESLLAAPLWAASHAVPEGDGFAGRYAMQGWQLMVNVVMRPILLTIGLLFSFFILRAIIGWAVKGYAAYNQSVVDSTSTTAITGIIFSNLILVGLVIVLAHKSSEMIYETADNIMKWIGFGTSPLGEVRSEGDVKSMVQSGAHTAERATAAGLGRITSGGKNHQGDGGDQGAGESGGGQVNGGTEAGPSQPPSA